MKIGYKDPVYKGRVLRVTGLRGDDKDIKELDITIMYTENTNEGCRALKAVALDGQIIPAIIRCINRRNKKKQKR